MKNFFLGIYDYLSAHKGMALALCLVILGLSLFGVLNLRYEEDIFSFLPRSEENDRYLDVYDKLGGNDKIAVFFTGGTLDDRIDAMHFFEDSWAENDPDHLYPRIEENSDEESVFEVSDFIAANFPYFLLEEDYDRMDSLLAEPGYMSRCLQERKASLSSPGFRNPYSRNDPLGLYTPVWQRLEKLNPMEGNRIEDGFLFTDDGATGVIFLDSPYGGSESRDNAGIVSYLGRIKEETRSACPEVEVISTGGPEVAVGNAGRIKKDSFQALFLAGFLILILLWLSYRRFADVLWIFLSIAYGAVFALGLISVFKSTISIIILGIGSMIIGIAVNYPLHYIDHLKYQPDKRKALAEQVNPLLVGNITTVGAFLSLMLLKAVALHDFGFIGGMMLVGTIFFVLLFLPVFFPLAKRPRNTIKLDLDRFVHPSPSVRKASFWCFLVLTLVLWFFGRKVTFNADLQRINYMTEEQAEGFRMLSSMAGTTAEKGTIYVVTEGEDVEQVLNEAASVSGSLEGLRGIAPFIPSRSEQEKRLSRRREFLDSHPGLSSELLAAAAREGFTEWAVSPFIEDLSKSWPIRDASYFAPLYTTVGKAMFFPEEGRTRVVSYLDVPAADLPAVQSDLKAALPPGSFCFNDSDLNGGLVSLLNQDFEKIGLLCSLIVFLFLWLTFGSLEVCLIAFLPMAVSWIWILGTMSIFGVGFNIINIILATFIFGQGDDYTVFITEGLMYERATGKKILRSYKNAVVLSALVMLAGIGSLIVARHPAMRSLAQVTMIGMSMVVLMACYLPPLVYNFLTKKKGGESRRTPLTFRNMIFTAYILIIFALALFTLSLWSMVYFSFGKDSEKKRLNYHKVIQRACRWAINSIPGGKFTVRNLSGEDFSKPAIIVCNHQSHFDVLAILALHPKIIFMTNDWVWKLYRRVIGKAEFFPASQGMEENGARMKELIARGYSVAIFPEGTRSEDCRVQRFHRGAFLAARELGLEILPLYIHGFGYALPKHDFLLRKAALTMEIGTRMTVPEGDILAFTREIRHHYVKEYSRICREKETAAYVAPFVRDRYRYKGHDTEAECRKYLRKSVFKEVDALDGESIEIPDAGCGVYPLLVALAHPGMKVVARSRDEDGWLTATRCDSLPENLTYVKDYEE